MIDKERRTLTLTNHLKLLRTNAIKLNHTWEVSPDRKLLLMNNFPKLKMKTTILTLTSLSSILFKHWLQMKSLMLISKFKIISFWLLLDSWNWREPLKKPNRPVEIGLLKRKNARLFSNRLNKRNSVWEEWKTKLDNVLRK